MPEMPSGTVTFLFTDIEGSTKRWQHSPKEMAGAVARHDAMLGAMIAEHGGSVFKTVGDAFCAVFPIAPSAVNAAVAIQRALGDEDWGPVGSIRVRMAIHAGDAEERDADYFGPAVNRVARLLSAGHGGQVLLSHSAAELVRDNLPSVAQLRDLGDHRLKDLTRPEHIFQLVTPGLEADFPPLVTLDNRPNNLPLQLTALIGREHEGAELQALLARDDVRLVTMTGPGGVGKTRLSLQVGSESVDTYPDGVWFVPLEESFDEPGVVMALGSALGVREGGGQSLTDSLVEYLRGKHLLLVLDNFEQVTQTAPLISRLLRAAPHIKALVTSRTRLGIQGEREYAVQPLALPQRDAPIVVPALLQCSAVALFVDRAQATSSGFTLTESNAAAVTEICRGLDALPLAIELAAARVKLLPPEALLKRMTQRLGLLTGGKGDRPVRQQTLRATIAWSYDLLSLEERTLFIRHAVFAAGFTLDAAEAVCNPDGSIDLLTGLEALVDHSLIRQAEDETGDLRFTMLVTIREFALEQLAEEEDGLTHARHLAWCLDLIQQAEPALRGPEQQRWLEQLEREHDNLRAALAWAESAGHGLDCLRLAAAMYSFWEMHGYLTEGRRWLESALALASDAPAGIRAKGLHGLACLMVDQGDSSQAAIMHARALALRRDGSDQAGIAESLAGLASARLRQGDLEQAGILYAESLALSREISEPWSIATAVNGAATVAHEKHEYERAQALYEESLGLFKKQGNLRQMAISLNNLATVAHDRRDYARAMELYEQSLALTRALEDKRTSAMALNNQGIVAHDQGDLLKATMLYEESLALFRNLGDQRGIAYLLLGLGIITDDQGNFAHAVTFHEESLALFESMGEKRGVASVLTAMAAAILHLGDTGRAEELYRRALDVCQETEDREGVVECLDGMGRISRDRGDVRLAVRLWAAGEAARNEDGGSMAAAARSSHDEEIAQARASLGEEPFSADWVAGLAMTLEDAIDELRAGATLERPVRSHADQTR